MTDSPQTIDEELGFDADHNIDDLEDDCTATLSVAAIEYKEISRA